MKGCSRFIALICVALFVLSAMLALFLVNVQSYLLSPETYSQVFSDVGIYQELPEIAADQLLYGMTFNPCLEDATKCEGEGTEPDSVGEEGGGPPSYFANLPGEVWQSVLTELIDPAWLEQQMGSVLEQVFSILTEDTTRDVIVISLSEIKDRVRSEGGFQAVMNVIQAQPDCTLDQMQEISLAIASEGMSDSILSCRPSEDLMALVQPYIRSGLTEVVRTLPASVEIEIPAELRVANSGAATALSITQAAFRYIPWVALFWLLAVTVLVVRDVRSWLGWWGPGFFMAGFTTGLLAAAIEPLLNWSLDRYLISQETMGFSPAVMTLALDVADRIISGFAGRILAQAGLMLGIGLLMLIFRFLTKPRSKGQIGQQLTEPRSDT